MSLEIAESPYVLGVDLGTSNSSASVYIKGVPTTLKLEGNLSIPSVVYFPKDLKDTDEKVKVGREAKKRILIEPDRAFASVKTVMKNGDWEKEQKDRFTIDDILYTPTDIAAEILRKIIEEIHLQTEVDLQGQVNQAVICVPANTTDEYRRNVLQAAAKAGFGVKDDNNEVILDEKGRPKGVTLIDEPTAAALAYGRELDIFDGAEKKQTILVYDLGGGTFDVTILSVDSTGDIPKFKVLATNGVGKLGGDDFDRSIMEMAAEVFNDQNGIDIFDTVNDQEATAGKDLRRAQQRLKEAAESAKIELASEGSTTAEIMLTSFLIDGNSKEYDLEVEIDKNEFIRRIQPLLDQTIDCVNDALKEADLDIDDINRVIMVGGSTKSDWVKDTVLKLGKQPYMAEYVDVIVSQGAGIYGAKKPTESGEDDIVESITNHHLGIELEGGQFSPIIPKGVQLDEEHPVVSATRVYGNQANTDILQISIWKTQEHIEYEGENGDAVPKEKVFINTKDGKFDCIGDFILKGIPKGPKGSQKIEVTMEIGKDNLLSVKAKVSGSEDETNLEINVV